jgi:hypothetical protein
VLAGSGFREEGVERVVAAAYGLIRRHLSIGLNSMFKTVQFPASISSLHTSLTQMNRKAFTHFERVLNN